ncbi:hypothetical protein HPB51_020771 [Rhipicephalus microplus]|uniref:Uncharacterized protein n=1 Tax=Rhipicephalus microplus TaxID=6941 RepID=A0A9J6DP47_RHIMP|nr:hypothetical protein HPB51_020771 [Rhipicephalus microplus]
MGAHSWITSQAASTAGSLTFGEHCQARGWEVIGSRASITWVGPPQNYQVVTDNGETRRPRVSAKDSQRSTDVVAHSSGRAARTTTSRDRKDRQTVHDLVEAARRGRRQSGDPSSHSSQLRGAGTGAVGLADQVDRETRRGGQKNSAWAEGRAPLAQLEETNCRDGLGQESSLQGLASAHPP